MTWREIVGWGLVAAGSVCGIAAAAIKGGTFEALTAAIRGRCSHVGLHQQVEGLKRDGPGAFATRAVKGGISSLVLGTWDAYATTLRRHSLTHPTHKPYRCFAEQF
jgi:hypothetical protein